MCALHDRGAGPDEGDGPAVRTRYEILGRGRPLSELYGAHRGETVLVLGNSDSLRGMDAMMWDGFPTIGINRILRVYEPTYMTVMDQSVMKDEHERMMASRARVKYLIYPGVMNSICRKLYSGEYYETEAMNNVCDPTQKRGSLRICTSGNSAYYCIQIAWRMGAKTILLAGVDLYWPPGKQSHFFGSGTDWGCRLAKPAEICDDFVRLADALRTYGVETYSVSPWDTPLRERLGYIPMEDAVERYA